MKYVPARLTAFDGIELLASRAKMESLMGCQPVHPIKKAASKQPLGERASVGLHEQSRGLDGLSYLGIDREARVPTIWRYDLADAVLPSLRCNLPNVCHRILELLLGGPEGWRFLQPMWSNPLGRFTYSERMSAPLDGGHVQGRSSPHAEGDVRRIDGIEAIGRVSRI